MRVAVGCDSSEILYDFLGAFCLSCAGFARDENGLVLAFVTHVDPGALCNREYVWWVLIAALVAILLYYRI